MVLGDMLMAEAKYKEAFDVFEKLFQSDGSNYYAVYKLGVLYLYANRPDLAEKNIAKAVELKPDFDEAKKALEYIRSRKKSIQIGCTSICTITFSRWQRRSAFPVSSSGCGL